MTIEFKCDLAWLSKENNLLCVSPANENHLVCFHCGTEELYHDAHAWYFLGNEKEGDDLMCETCAEKVNPDSNWEKYQNEGKPCTIQGKSYYTVITFH
jgi:hypothetical protein